MTDLPEPLTSPECDLRGLEWMPLYGDRLFESDTWLMASPEGRGAALALWWAAWKQRPAGSLPDQDRALAQLAGYGISISSWLAIRDEAMRGWVKCSDGRLYHPMVCTLAREAWERRLKERNRKAAMRAKAAPQEAASASAGNPRDEHGISADVPRTSRGCPAGQDADGTRLSALTGQDRTEEDKKDDAPTEHCPPGRTSAPDALPLELDESVAQRSPEWAVQVWNRVCGPTQGAVTRISDKRRRALSARLRVEFRAGSGWEEFCRTIVETPFLTGQNDRGWVADFDWCISPTNILKITEGKYARKGAGLGPPQRESRTAWTHKDEPPTIDMDLAA